MTITTSAELLDALMPHLTLSGFIHETTLGKDAHGFPQEVWIKGGSCEIYVTHWDDDEPPFMFTIMWSGNDVLDTKVKTIEEGIRWTRGSIVGHIMDWEALGSALKEWR